MAFRHLPGRETITNLYFSYGKRIGKQLKFTVNATPEPKNPSDNYAA